MNNRILLVLVLLFSSLKANEIIVNVDKNKIVAYSNNKENKVLYYSGERKIKSMKFNKINNLVYFIEGKHEYSHKSDTLYMLKLQGLNKKKVIEKNVYKFAIDQNGDVVVAFYGDDDTLFLSTPDSKWQVEIGIGEEISNLQFSKGNIVYSKGETGGNIFYLKKGANLIKESKFKFNVFTLFEGKYVVGFSGDESYPAQMIFATIGNDSVLTVLDVMEDNIVLWGSTIALDPENKRIFFLAHKELLEANGKELIEAFMEYDRNISVCLYEINTISRKINRSPIKEISAISGFSNNKIILTTRLQPSKKYSVKIFNISKDKYSKIKQIDGISLDPLSEIGLKCED